MRPLWLPNLKKFLTGTTNGSKQCLDVHVANSITATIGDKTQLEFRFQDASVTGINANSGAFVQVGDTNFAASDIANTITELRVRNQTGSALVFAAGANAAAAAAASPLLIVAAGGVDEITVALSSGDKIWVRALEASGVSTGKVLALLLG